MFSLPSFNCTTLLGDDYQLDSGSVTFGMGSGVGTTVSVMVTIINDETVEESTETFTVELSAISGTPVTITGDSSVTVAIQEDLTDSMWY